MEEIKKKISAAVLIVDPVTSGILASHATGCKFKDEEGKAATGCWGLLKGEIDKDEDPEEAAVREVYEESGIKLKKKDLIYLGYQRYNLYKDLELFLYIDKKHIDHKTLKCDSYFENEKGEMLPEVNGYAWFNWPDDKKYLYKVQQIVIERVWPKVEEYIIEKQVKEIDELKENFSTIWDRRRQCSYIESTQRGSHPIIDSREKMSEQKLNQINKVYYHGSYKELERLEPQKEYCGIDHKYGCIFLTPNKDFAVQFVNKFKGEKKVYLYHCKIKSHRINLFNMNYNKDWVRLEKMIEREGLSVDEEELVKLYERLYKKEYRKGGEDLWMEFEQSILPDLCYEAGFDGFSNRGDLSEDFLELKPEFKGFPPANNFALFDPGKIIIEKREEL